MRTRCIDNSLIVVLERGDDVVSSLISACRDHKVSAASVSGIGAVRAVTLAYYDLTERCYHTIDLSGDFEVVSLLGNISLLDGIPMLHAHVSLSDEGMRVVGGHLKKAEVAVTLEVFMTILNQPLIRSHNETIGLPLLSL